MRFVGRYWRVPTHPSVYALDVRLVVRLPRACFLRGAPTARKGRPSYSGPSQAESALGGGSTLGSGAFVLSGTEASRGRRGGVGRGISRACPFRASKDKSAVEANGCAFGACAIGGRSTRRHRYVLVLASLMAMWSPHQTMLRAVVGGAMVGGHREARSGTGASIESEVPGACVPNVPDLRWRRGVWRHEA